MVSLFLEIKYFYIKICTLFFRQNSTAHLIDYDGVKTFICTVKPKICVTGFIAVFALLSDRESNLRYLQSMPAVKVVDQPCIKLP